MIDWLKNTFGFGSDGSKPERKQLPTDRDIAKSAEKRIEYLKRIESSIQSGDVSPEALKEAPDLLPMFQDGEPEWPEWDTQKAIEEGYEAVPWVYACIWRIAKSAASADWKVYRVDGDERERVPDSPLQQLIDEPNDKLTTQSLVEIMTTQLYLGGNSLIQKNRVNGIPVELWPIKVQHIKPQKSNSNWIDGYEYNLAEKTDFFDADNMIHARFSDPADLRWGMSPLEAGAKAVDTDREALNHQKVSLENNAMASGILTFDRPIDQGTWEDAKERIREEHQGSDNAREPWVLGHDAKWQQMSLSPAEMDYIKSRKMTRTEICGIFQTPPPLVGIYDNATLSNIETARRIFWEDTITPFLDDIKAVFNLSLAPEFGDNLEIDYDIKHISALLGNIERKIELAQKLWKMGVPMAKIDEFLNLGIPDYPGKNISWIPGSVMPAGTVTSDPNAEPLDDE